MPLVRALSAPLLLGLVAGAYGVVMFAGILALDDRGEVMRWHASHRASTLVQHVLVGYGLLALARRVHGPDRRRLRLAAAAVAVPLVVQLGLEPVLVLAAPDEHRAWIANLDAVALLAATLAITLAGSAWARSPGLAGVAVAAAVVSPWMPGVGAPLALVLGPQLGFLFVVARELVWAGCLIAMLHRVARDAEVAAPDVARASRGLSTARTAALVWGAAVLAGAIVATSIAPGPTLLGSITRLAIAASLVALAVGVLQLEAASLDELPRLPLAFVAAAITWSAGTMLEDTLTLWTLVPEPDGSFRSMFREPARPWQYLGPLVGGGGIVLLAWTFARYAGARWDAQLRSRVVVYTAGFVVAWSVAVLADASNLAAHPSTRSAAVHAGCIAVSVSLLVGVLRRVEAALAAGDALPRARVTRPA